MRMKLVAVILGAALLAGCATVGNQPAKALVFGAEMRPGRADSSPAWPFMRIGPDGRLHLVWTELDPTTTAPAGAGAAGSSADHDHGAAGIRAAFMANSSDGGTTWTEPLRINDQVENVQGDENEAKIAFGSNGQIYSAWAIPDATGNKMKANIRFSMLDEKGKFKPAQTLNEVADAARFVALQTAPDGTVFAAWIDRRVDSPAPRAIYMTRISSTGRVLTGNYKIADDSCECCRLTMAFADGGKTIYVAYRQKPADNNRNIVIRKSTDGGATFGDPVVVSDDGWVINGCPHAGAVMTTDAKGNVHVIWYTMGRKPKEAGIYYSASTDGGRTFSPRQLVHAGEGTGVLRPYLAVGEQGDVYMAWMNYLPGKDQTQIFFRHLAAGGRTMSPVQQLSQTEGNAQWPNVAVSKERVYLSWTESKEDATWVVLRAAPITNP
ncbi:MAG TPA: sialidase family protein [Symbiobacteriaceae bacterium]|nr:sialidase family protein [Symbiobacteriaceae bacterium]